MLPRPNAEHIHRLVLGLALHDAARNLPAAAAIARDRPPLPRVWFDRHDSGRYSITFRSGLPSELRFRVTSEHRRFVPRRFSFTFATETDLFGPPEQPPDQRFLRTARRLSLFPGAAYPAPAGATGIRGRMLRNGGPLRWGRLEARVGGTLVGRAHCDDAGEYLLLLGMVPGVIALPEPISVEVTVRGPNVPPDRTVLDPDGVDPLWDLPIEPLPDSGVPSPVPIDDVAGGIADPAGYRASLGGTFTVPAPQGRVTAVPAETFT